MKRLMGLLVVALAAAISVFEASAQTVWYNPENAGFQVIQGQAYYGQPRESFYHRFPASAEALVRSSVWSLSKQSAGESILTRHPNFRTVSVLSVEFNSRHACSRHMRHSMCLCDGVADSYVLCICGKYNAFSGRLL